MIGLRPRPAVHLFLLWSESRREQDRILADIAARFRVLDRVEVTWTPDDTFARSLTRMYGDALPPGSDKERHCGTGPFLVVVVEDPRPRYRPRHAGGRRRLLDSNVYDARLRYRAWTGGGYRVHASDSVTETDRNLALLFGTRVSDVRSSAPSDGVRTHLADPVGTEGWDSVAQLLSVLEPYGAHPVDGHGDGAALAVLADDVWWAEHIAGGREVRPGVREVVVAGRPLELTIDQRHPLPVRAANAVIAAAVRRRRPPPPDRSGQAP